MDDANNVYEEKRLLGPFHGLTMNYEGSNKEIFSKLDVEYCQHCIALEVEL